MRRSGSTAKNRYVVWEYGWTTMGLTDYLSTQMIIFKCKRLALLTLLCLLCKSFKKEIINSANLSLQYTSFQSFLQKLLFLFSIHFSELITYQYSGFFFFNVSRNIKFLKTKWRKWIMMLIYKSLLAKSLTSSAYKSILF